MDKNASRIRRARRTRAKIRELGAHRLCVHRSINHIYAQIYDVHGAVVAAASTLEKELNAHGNKEGAKVIGKVIAERALNAGVKNVAFDRSGYKYHGRIKALADAARESGLQF